MSNMPYCRFENTLKDLLDCYENMEDWENLSESELVAFFRVLETCRDIFYDYEGVLEEHSDSWFGYLENIRRKNINE